MRLFLLGVALALLGALHAEASSSVLKRIDAPCTACQAVAAEIQRRIDNEPVRNHLDLRHRLDKDGQRYGKVIAYKASELRAVELLDLLCDRMRDYSLVSPAGKRTVFWLKVKGVGAANTSAAAVTRRPREEEDAQGKRLEAYCGTLMEEYEEELYGGIMKGGFDTQGVEPILCRTILQPCPLAPAEPASADGAAAAEGAEAAEGPAREASAEDVAAGGTVAAAGAEAGATGDAPAAGASAGAGEGTGTGTRYIDNLTLEMGKDGNFEL